MNIPANRGGFPIVNRPNAIRSQYRVNILFAGRGIRLQCADTFGHTDDNAAAVHFVIAQVKEVNE